MEKTYDHLPGDIEQSCDDDSAEQAELLRNIVSAVFEENQKKAMKSRNVTEMYEQGYTEKNGQIFMKPGVIEGQEHRGEEISASLTDENFADALSRRVWEMLSERTRNNVLVDFKCSGCLLGRTQNITTEEIRNMTGKQLDAAMKKAMELQRSEAGTPKMNVNCLTQIEDIRISFTPSNAPGAMEGRNTIQIAGTCVKCGCGITRTFFSEEMQLVNAFGSLMKLSGDNKRSKTGRNDPCPCGSGKKYKKCCGMSL